MSRRRRGDGRGAVVRLALRNRDFRRVLAAYLRFNVSERGRARRRAVSEFSRRRPGSAVR